MTSVICKKCLIGMDAENYLELIEKNRSAVRERDRTAEEDYRNRIAVCEACEHLSGPTCLACGCYVELRAIRKVSHCPYKKW